MKTRFLGLLLIMGVLSAVSCASPGFGPLGSWYTGTKIGVYGGDLSGNKNGEACVQTVLGLVAWGDASVEAAAEDGGIKEVGTVDLEGFSILGLYGKLCTVVTGK